MSKAPQKRIFAFIATAIILICSFGPNIASAVDPAESASTITAQGRISWPGTTVDVSVDFSQTIGINSLSTGVHVAHDYIELINNPELQTIFAQADFKLIRFYVSEMQPCQSWNEQTLSGTFDWNNFDQLMETITKTSPNADILISVNNNPGSYPNGMSGNYDDTNFPDPTSFAQYCQVIAQHIKEKGWTVKYWEPYNEPYQVFDSDRSFNAFVNLFNQATNAVLEVLPYAQFGVDTSNIKDFLDPFAKVAQNVGFLSFHKYNSAGTQYYNPSGYYTDDEVFEITNTLNYPVWINNAYHETYTPAEMQSVWFTNNGAILPVLCTETNLSGIYINGTDPRIQQIMGAAWYAEELRAFALNGVSSSTYFHFSSDEGKNWGTTTLTQGYGFGMVNYTTPNTVWYPYLVNYLFGNKLNTNDQIYSSSSSDTLAVSTLSWISNEKLNVLLIGKTSNPINVAVNLQNANLGEEITIQKISGESTAIQNLSLTATDQLYFHEDSYFVILITA